MDGNRFMGDIYWPYVILSASVGFTVLLLLYVYYRETILKPHKNFIPEISVQKVPNGYRLTDRTFSGENFLGLLVGLSLLGGLIGVPYGLQVYFEIDYLNLLHTLRSELSLTNLAVFGFLGLLVVLMLLLMLAGSVLKLFKTSRLNEAVLTLEKWPIPLGETCEVTYERTLSDGMEINDVKATLSCVEKHRTGTGSRASSFVETVEERKLNSERSISQRGTVKLNWTLNVPEESPSSLEIRNHSLTWALSVQLDLDGFPDDSSSFELLVLPSTADVSA